MYQHTGFDEQRLLKNLKHYLPAQAPLKDFVHHNTLHKFQDRKFHDGLVMASKLFGYKVYLSLREYRDLYTRGIIREDILRQVVKERHGAENVAAWQEKLVSSPEEQQYTRIGALRAHWKDQYHFDLDGRVHVNLFRLLNSYLDQGVALWPFPVTNTGLLNAVRRLDMDSYSGFFRTGRARVLLHDAKIGLEELLKILVGDPALYEQYVFDQQFGHPGWSGLVATIEEQPHTLLDARRITLHDLVAIELLLEIDTLGQKFGTTWRPVSETLKERPPGLFENFNHSTQDDIKATWQEAYEWSYYDEVLAGLQTERPKRSLERSNKFMAFFCIDDREISLRQHIEEIEKKCQTFSTPGHFAIDAFYEPQNGKFHTKICPVPVEPKHLICEEAPSPSQKKELHLNRRAHHLLTGWIISQTVGFWSAFKLFLNVFKPSASPASASAFRHMDPQARLEYENKNPEDRKHGLQRGYTIPEMADRVEAVLKSTGLVENFAPLIYMIGHGASSTNNTHFAAYDCGACSGRPGSVNGRVFSAMANHPEVRKILADRGTSIPSTTCFVGGLHDTTVDEIRFYDIGLLSVDQLQGHMANVKTFNEALLRNAKERSRRFNLVNTARDKAVVYKKVGQRAMTLFEPRPEYNHATNSLCIVARRDLTHNLFLDRRAFLNSFDYRVDPDGKYLPGILNAATPVCGGINLEYYFSRTDNHKLGAGSKLSHNVMGLIGVANGTEGDLRPGLPLQMIEIHDPLRLLIVVEHLPDVVLTTIQKNPATYEWFIHEWVNLVVVHPETKECYRFKDGSFTLYVPLKKHIPVVTNCEKLFETSCENLPVFTIKNTTV